MKNLYNACNSYGVLVPTVGTLCGRKFGCWPRVGELYRFGGWELRCVKITEDMAYFVPDDYYKLDDEIINSCSPNITVLTNAWVTNAIGETIRGDIPSIDVFWASDFYAAFADGLPILIKEDLKSVWPYYRSGKPSEYLVDVCDSRHNKDGRWRCTVCMLDGSLKVKFLTKEEVGLYFRPLITVMLKEFSNPTEECSVLTTAKLPNVGEVTIGSEIWANCAKKRGDIIVVDPGDLDKYDSVTTLRVKITDIGQSVVEPSVIGSTDWGPIRLIRFHSFYSNKRSARLALESAAPVKKVHLSDLPNLNRETLKKVAENPELLDTSK